MPKLRKKKKKWWQKNVFFHSEFPNESPKFLQIPFLRSTSRKYKEHRLLCPLATVLRPRSAPSFSFISSNSNPVFRTDSFPCNIPYRPFPPCVMTEAADIALQPRDLSRSIVRLSLDFAPVYNCVRFSNENLRVFRCDVEDIKVIWLM